MFSAFGRRPTGDRKKRIEQSPNYKNGKFVNKNYTPDLNPKYSFWQLLGEYFKKHIDKNPVAAIPADKVNLNGISPEDNCLIWFGHSSYLIHFAGKRILVDPVFSGAAAPFSFLLRAYNGADAYSTEDLPEIDLLILSHDHYDHTDYDTLKKIKPKVKKVLTSLGVGSHLEYWGYNGDKISGPTSFCTGGSVVLSANTGSGYTYMWKKNGTTIGGATSSSYTCTTSGSYTVVVTTSGCSATSAAVTITVSAAPTATITTGGATTFCPGGSVVLTTNTGTGYTYVWKRNGTVISGATANTSTATQAGSHTVTITSGGCSTTSTTTTITLSAAPSATITPNGSTSFCTGGSVVLYANTGTGFAYVWKKNGTTISGATSSSYTATTSGAYTVTITSGSCATTSAATTVAVGTAPTATITPASTTSICSGTTVVLNANTGTGYTYIWKLNGTAISGATASSYSATAAGSYTVTVTNSGRATTTPDKTEELMSKEVLQKTRPRFVNA